MVVWRAKVTSKGQVTLPKQIRESLSIRTGDRLEFCLDSSTRVSIRKNRAPGSSAGIAGHLIPPGQQQLSLEAMDEAIRAYARKKLPNGGQGK